MAFDQASAAWILTGGRNGGNATLTDTWKFDGAHWSQVGAQSPACVSAAMVGAPAPGTFLFCSPNTGTSDTVATYTFANGGWSLPHPSPSSQPPAAFTSATAVFDTKSQSILLYATTGSAHTLYQLTGLTNGSYAWSTIVASGQGNDPLAIAAAPEANNQPLGVIGLTSGGVVVLSGSSPGSKWVADAGHSASAPSTVLQVLSDPTEQRVLVIGSSGGPAQTCVFDGNKWTPQSVPPALASRLGSADSAGPEVLLYGGGASTDTWTWSVNNGWRQLG